jgi:hypothetical protein
MTDIEAGRLSLDGFEDALIAYIAEAFRYAGGYLSNVPLKVGRHLFVQDMKDTDTLVADAAALNEPFDPEKEPVIAIFTAANNGITPSQSRGSRHEWMLRIIMRHTTVMEECKARLEELVEFLNTTMRGAYISRYAIKGAILVQRPTAFQLEDSEQAYCDVQLRLYAVPRVTAS